MNPWIAILLFCLNVLDDMLAVFYVRRTAQGKAAQAALLSGALTAIVSISVISYIEERTYLIPIVFGSILGSYFAVKMDKAYRRRKYGRRKKKTENPPISNPSPE